MSRYHVSASKLHARWVAATLNRVRLGATLGEQRASARNPRDQPALGTFQARWAQVVLPNRPYRPAPARATRGPASGRASHWRQASASKSPIGSSVYVHELGTYAKSNHGQRSRLEGFELRRPDAHESRTDEKAFVPANRAQPERASPNVAPAWYPCRAPRPSARFVQPALMCQSRCKSYSPQASSSRSSRHRPDQVCWTRHRHQIAAGSVR